MNSRKAKLLFVRPGDKIRISNRSLARWAPSGVERGFPAQYYVIDTKPSAKQNRWRNHGK